MVNQFRQLEEKVALLQVFKAVFLAEAEFLGDARDAEGLAGEAGAEDVVRRDGVVGHGVDVAVNSAAADGASCGFGNTSSKSRNLSFARFKKSWP